MKKKDRAPKGTGRVFQRGSRWYGRLRKDRIETLTDPCDTEAGARRALDALIKGEEIQPEFAPTLSQWWESLVKEGGIYEGRYDAQTKDLHETVWANHVHGSPIGKKLVSEITKADCQRWINSLKKRPWTVRRYGSCLQVALKEAVDAEIIAVTPAIGLKYPTIMESESSVLSEKEAHELPIALHKEKPRLSAMVTVMVDAGLRPGEVCFIRWKDLNDSDPDFPMLAVRGSIDHAGKAKHTKTGKARLVDLTQDAYAAILEQPRVIAHIFTTEDNQVMRPHGLTLDLRRWLTRKGFPIITPRDLRKTFVTRAVMAGDVRTAQELAGHASPEITQRVYARSNREAARATVKKMEEKTGTRGVFGQKKAIGIQNRGTGS